MSTPADTFTDRTDATDEEFQARVAVFDAAEEPEEVVVERVARAIYEADSGNTWEDCWLPSRWHTAARAALAALRGDRS